jgi:hypothetical protein
MIVWCKVLQSVRFRVAIFKFYFRDVTIATRELTPGHKEKKGASLLYT